MACVRRPESTNCVEKLCLIGALEIRPMMGERRVMQEALFYGFTLERRVPITCCARSIGLSIFPG